MKTTPAIAAAMVVTGVALTAATALAAGLGPDRPGEIRGAQTGATIRVEDVDADLRRGGRLQLEAETTGARRVTFTYAGRSLRGRLVEIDDDGDREWRRTVAARAIDREGGRIITIRVRACAGDVCVVRSAREYLERPGEDD